MSAYYNENDPFAAGWLRNLITAKLIAAGDVDTRSIKDVKADDLKGYWQHHFFAGIGGWSYALRLAGWPDNRPVWTGSCPCQPFSGAGKRKGTADARHLWPDFYHLIGERRPATIFGEQIASKDGRLWLAGVRADLEGLGYGVGAADLCAAGVGAPHIRQRLYWMADATGERRIGIDPLLRAEGRGQGASAVSEVAGRGVDSGVANSDSATEWSGGPEHKSRDSEAEAGTGQHDRIGRSSSAPGWVGDAATIGRLEERADAGRRGERDSAQGTAERSGFWSGAVWLPCLDGKARRVEPGVFPLDHGVPARVGRLRGYGNAIVPQVAAQFIGAYQDLNRW